MSDYRHVSPSTPSEPATHGKRKITAEPESGSEGEGGPDDNRKKKVRWDGPTDDDDTSEETNRAEKVRLFFHACSGRIGCSYYDPVKCLVYVLEDTQEDGSHYDLTKMLLEQASPNVVLVSSKADDEFIDVCSDFMDQSGGFFQIRPYKDFAPNKGRSSLLSLGLLSHLPAEDMQEMEEIYAHSEPRNAYEFMERRRDVDGDPTMKRWNAAVRMSNFAALDTSPLCLGSMGALLDYLARERAVGDLEDEGVGGLEVRGIEMFSLDQVMQINADALFSLQIFENESHASIHSDRTKEGLSLFGILNNTKTTLGRDLMRTWFLRPSLSLSTIIARHDAVACFTRTENLDAVNTLHNQLKGIKNVPKILAAMRTGKAGVADWQGLVKFAFSSALIRDNVAEMSMGRDVEIVKKLVTAFDAANFKGIAAIVNEIIDWEDSSTAGRVCVRPHIDEELDNRKHLYNGIDAVLSKVAHDISPTVPDDYATSLNAVYFPQLGFLVCVPMLDEWKSGQGIQVLDGWTFQSESYNYSLEDREIEIMQELQEKIMVDDEIMSQACAICAELDCLLSFAEASVAFNYRRPQMTEENVIIIKQGRHPLQEQVVDTFVPNDSLVVGGAGIGSFPIVHGEDDDLSSDGTILGNSVMICTGANACGKSVYLKQTALIHYVPTESATLGLVDKIFTRVQTRESVSKVQSAFMIDLNQVSLALRNSTARSLILLDEFGKGTKSTDGAGLFCGVIKHLLDRGVECPKVLATTHFHDVFRSAMLEPHMLPISFVHMEVMFSTSSGEVVPMSDSSSETGFSQRTLAKGEQFTYLYRVANGLSLDSHAVQCAKIFGIPTHVVERAQYIHDLLVSHEITHLLDEGMTEDDEHDMEMSEEVCRRFLNWDLEEEDAKHVKIQLAEVLGREASEQS
ncbi:hypothetical protein BV25DRAFT_1870738 [Artomyces pyxidatus]|uniref:Uncharacterized protein n=1 Tax=Artomyces pyxidatus TaxID=48021 RepID=A0ACB8SXT4_9AGAM|nr:hypothetical protein BV25DRAFT_1870738 [Artomyces pyxidatus]